MAVTSYSLNQLTRVWEVLVAQMGITWLVVIGRCFARVAGEAEANCFPAGS